jgi:putative ABC transport system permease protein
MNLVLRIMPWLIPGGIPLAWRQLIYNKPRFITALAGVSFGVVIMLFQFGIYQAIMKMVIRPIVAVRGDLMLVSRDYQFLISPDSFPERRLYQVLADKDVEAIYPFSISFEMWRNPESGAKIRTAFMGVYAGKNPFLLPEAASRDDVLSNPEGVLFDKGSAREFGDVEGLFKKQGAFLDEINGRRVLVCGIFTMGRTLAVYGNVIAGMETYKRISEQVSGLINVGLISLLPGVVPEEAAARIQRILPDDVKIITRQEIIRCEQTYWRDNTPIGFVVVAGMFLGLFVGTVIVYQILYSDINDHIKEYATLKALGLGQGYFVKFIVSESLILLVIGFIPGISISAALFYAASSLAGIPAQLTLSGTMIVFSLTAVMCISAGLLATRRIRSVDPAEIF